MKDSYGAEFEDYMADVPRFGSPSALTAFILSQLQLKIPPLIIVVVCAGVMYICAQTIQHPLVFAASIRVILGAAAWLVAGAILSAALIAFRRHRTTMNPLYPGQTGIKWLGADRRCRATDSCPASLLRPDWTATHASANRRILD